MNKLIQNESGELSFTKIGAKITLAAIALMQANIDIIPSSKIDETIIKIIAFVGGALFLDGMRDLAGKFLTQMKAGQ